jgi:endonuclease G
VTVFASEVTDLDSDDPPNNMAANYVFSFNSEFFRDPAEHMVMGNPSNATLNTSDSTNFLMMKLQYALSYNDSRGGPNWTSWHLDSTWRGSAPRQDDFRADTTLPSGYHRVQGGEGAEVNDFSGSGFDRGHMCPSADRTSTIPDNSATFLMTNMLAQAPDNNQGPWAAFENYLRTFLPDNEVYIISGGTGTGGIGSNGSANTIAGGFVTVPAQTWKVALILPVGDDDVSRVAGNARTIAVIMPNVQGIRSDQWQKYLATVDQVEALSTYDFYSSVPESTQGQFEALLDAPNDTAPVTSDQNKTTSEDQGVAVILSATDFNVNNTFTFTVVDQPTNGSVSCSNGDCTYSPNVHFFGADQFTYKANDGALDSNVSTVNITVTEVNSDPIAANDSKETAEDSTLNFSSSDLTSNDSAGTNEGIQTLTVDSVVSTPNTHGNIGLSSGNITYTPDANYNGPASFDYQVCDNGTTNGAPDPKCSIGTVNVTVNPVNDGPTADSQSVNTDANTALAITLTGSDLETATGSLTFTVTTGPSHGVLSGTGPNRTYTPAVNYSGPDSFTFTVTDSGDGTSAPLTTSPATVSISVNDTVGPYLTSSVAMTSISSPNSNLFNVGLSATATDNGGGPVTITVTVVGDENDETPTIDSIVHSPDAKDIAPNTLRLRGERIEDGDGRVYLIIVTATDSSGNVSRNYHTVVVPKGNSPARVAQVNAQAAAALSYAQANNGATPPGYFVIGDGPVIGPKQ